MVQIQIQKLTLTTRKYKAGYEVRKELWTVPDAAPTLMRSAYTPSGDYIGDPKRAHGLVKVLGIIPEKSRSDHSVCSIGWCEREQKWYGWSHRAIFGYGVGSTVAKDSCAYRPASKEDFIEACQLFWGDVCDIIDVADEGILIGSSGPGGHTRLKPFPEQYGRGEWTAKTLKDAKQMAIDFAEGVS